MTPDDPHAEQPDVEQPDAEKPGAPVVPAAGPAFLGRTTASPGVGISTPDELVALLVAGGVPAEQVMQETMVTVTVSETEWLSLVPRFDALGSYWYIHRYDDEQHWVHETAHPREAVGFVAGKFTRSAHVNGSRPDAQSAGGSEGAEGPDGAP